MDKHAATWSEQRFNGNSESRRVKWIRRRGLEVRL